MSKNKWRVDTRNGLFKTHMGLCWWCGVKTKNGSFSRDDETATIEHLIRISERPDLKKDKYNLVLACRKCNVERS